MMSKSAHAEQLMGTMGLVLRWSLVFILSALLLAGCAQDKTNPSSTAAAPEVTPAPSSTPPPTSAQPVPATTAGMPAITPTQNRISVAIPLMDMTANDNYKGEDGGLYGKGLNQPPQSHRDAALRELAKVKPLNAQGNFSPAGKVVLISIGMSNATQEFAVFKRSADTDPEKSPGLLIVDGAQGGQTALIWATQEKPWQVLEQRLQEAGVTPEQVQVVWAKQANSQPGKIFPTEAKALQTHLATIMNLLKKRYPNVKIVYLSSRIYAGYATTGLNPEPHAFESAFSVRWLVQDQISGNPGLNYDPDIGPVTSPLLLWGPYLWADGLNPRSVSE